MQRVQEHYPQKNECYKQGAAKSGKVIFTPTRSDPAAAGVEEKPELMDFPENDFDGGFR